MEIGVELLLPECYDKDVLKQRVRPDVKACAAKIKNYR